MFVPEEAVQYPTALNIYTSSMEGWSELMIISAALTTPCSDFHAPMAVLQHHAAIVLLLMLSKAPLQASFGFGLSEQPYVMQPFRGCFYSCCSFFCFIHLELLKARNLVAYIIEHRAG